MKKSLILTSILLISSTTLMAARAGDTIVGVEFGSLSTNATASAPTKGSYTGTDRSTYEALKVAKYFNYGRVGVSLGHGNTVDGGNTNYLGISYDYMFYNKSKLVPFIGLVTDYSNTKVSSNGISVNINGFSYGGELGCTYGVTKHIDLEIGARYLTSNASGATTTSINGTTVDININLNSIQQYYFGLNYKF